MRQRSFLWAMLGLALAGAAAVAPAQQRDGTIEQSPLAPPEPRLPGGTVVGPEGAPATDLPSVPEGEPAAPDDETATGATPETVPESPLETGAEGEADRAALDRQLPEREDLFKRAPPGTGGLGPQMPTRIVPVEREERPGAVIRQLDKLTGRIDTVTIGAGEETDVERLRIALAECHAPVDGSSANHIAFLRIWDRKEQDSDAVFTGWMFADSPGLSAMDHPRYDVWVIRCSTAEGSASSANE